MATLLFVRHAPTADTGIRLTGRLGGVGLGPDGKEMAASVAATLAEQELAAVYTSPVRRCRETARPIAASHGLRPIPDHRLTEVDYGEWSGRTLASLRRTRLWRMVAATPSRVRFPDGERLTSVQARAVAACEDIAGAHPDASTVVVVSHGDVIKAILAHYLGMHLDAFQRLVVEPASISAVRIDDGGPRILLLNRPPEVSR